MIKCPFCSEEIQEEAIKCKHCSSDLSTKEAKLKIKIQKKTAEKNQLIEEVKQRGFPKEVTDHFLKDISLFKEIRNKTNEIIIANIHEKIRKSRIILAYLIAFILMCIGLFSRGLIFDLFVFALVFAIWFHPETYEKSLTGMKDRLSHFRSYPIRISFSIFVAFLAFVIVASGYEENRKSDEIRNHENQRLEAEKIEIEEDKKNYSTPIIQVESNQGLQTTPTYTLIFTASGADIITVNGELLSGSGTKYSKIISMNSPLIKLNIQAKNKYYSKNEVVTVSRVKTAQEIQTEKEQEQLRKKQQELVQLEAKKAEISKMFSAWDGSYAQLVKMVKDSMNDPDSFEHDNTIWSLIQDSKNGDKVRIRMNYRGKNGFGAMVRGNILAEVNLKENTITVLEE